MKYWALVVVILYILILFFVFIVPLAIFGLHDRASGTLAFDELTKWWVTFPQNFKQGLPNHDNWFIWVYFGIMLVAQAALLSVPVEMTGKRPVTKRTVVPLFIATSLMMGVLVTGAGLGITEVLTKGIDSSLFMAPFAVSLVVWVFWAVVFFKWSKKMEPRGFIERQCKYLFAGSILQLLIAVPAHIIARHRDYCCAGLYTFVGIAFGVSVMLFSFGPGVFFLFTERLKNLKKAN